MSDHATHPVDYLPELALGVLPEAEAAEIEAVVTACEECKEELRLLQSAVRVLPAAASPGEPSPLVRDAVLQRIRAEQLDATAAPAARAIREPANVVRPRWAWLGAAVAAAIAAIVAAGVGGYALRGGDSADARETAVVEAAGRGDLLVARFEDGGVETSLVRAPGESDAFAWVENLPALPEGKAYQAWFTRDGATFEPSDVFTASDGGTWLSADAAIDDYAAMGFTIEDKGGAETPSSAPFVVVELQRSARTAEVPRFMRGEADP
jgi:hypothetical protein